MPKLKIDLDNSTQGGDTTLNQIEEDLKGIGLRYKPYKIRDPNTGKLVQVTLHLPFDVSQADLMTAQDKINANPGVAYSVSPLMESCFIFDLSNISFTGTLQSGQIIRIFTADPFSPVGPTFMGEIRPEGYRDGGQNVMGWQASYVMFLNYNKEYDLPIGLDPIELTYNGQTIVIKNDKDLILKKPVYSDLNWLGAWFRKDGLLYLRHFGIEEDHWPFVNYDESQEAGLLLTSKAIYPYLKP